jgi:pyruvate dehydrogenase E2 component (dihydrolipoamide acetyltransferase)
VPAPPPANGNGRLRASPLAKKIAAESGLDLHAVTGSGPQGRVVKKDVEEALAQPRPAARPRSAPGVRAPAQVLPLTQMRKVIAERLGEVKPGVPHFYLTVDLEMDAALKLREEAKQLEQKISVNDIVVKATAIAVRRFPRINQVYMGDHIEQLSTVDVGVAVAIADGLITPIVRDADQKTVGEIAQEVRELAERAKKKALKPEEYTGGSITVSNLGMFGIDSFIAVLNPPQAAILAVGQVQPKVVVRDGQMVVRQMMSVTLSGDHRVIDGAVGAEFLKELRGLIEHPLRLLL